jgi:hypothetical protein
MREYRYTVDRDGRIFHEGSEITDGEPSAPASVASLCISSAHT